MDKSEAITRDLATRLTNLKLLKQLKRLLQRELDELQVRQKALEAENKSLKDINEEFVVSYGKDWQIKMG